MFWPCHFLWKFEQSVVSKNASCQCLSIEFDFSDQNYFYSNSSIERDEGSVTQTIVEEEGVVVSQRWFGWAKGSTDPFWGHVSCPSVCRFVRCCATRCGEISSEWLLRSRDLPHTYSCTCFIQTKETKKQRGALLARSDGAWILLQGFFIFIYFIISF